MATPKHFNTRGKIGKILIGKVLYFKSPSRDKKRMYHYKQNVRKDGQGTKTQQITKQKYENAKRRIRL